MNTACDHCGTTDEPELVLLDSGDAVCGPCQWDNDQGCVNCGAPQAIYCRCD